MDRIRGAWCVLAISAVSEVAHASTGEEPDPSPPERPGARVIWAAPGQAPERPRPAVSSESEPPRPHRFGVGDVRWLVGIERASSIVGYSSMADTDHGSEIVTNGVEASIIGHVNQDSFTPLVMPRLNLDARWASGFSLGLVLSYATRSAEQRVDGLKEPLPSSEAALVGPRVGWLKPLTSHVAIWLRGGPTWARRAVSGPTSEPGERRTAIDQQWALSLEPQLVVMPWRHLGLSLGAAFDVGFDGESNVTYSGGRQPDLGPLRATVSTYGVTAGLLALF